VSGRDDAPAPRGAELINAPGLAPAVGFSHAARAGTIVFLAGQAAQGPDGAIVGQTVAEQFDVAAKNLVQALRAAGGAPEDLVWLQVFVTDVDAYRRSLGQLGDVWRRHFGRRYPAMGLFGVSELFDPAAKVELMGLAALPGAGPAPRA